MVGPTNVKPRAESSFDMAREIGVSAGTCDIERKVLIFGFPSTKSHNSLEKPSPFPSPQARPARRALRRRSSGDCVRCRRPSSAPLFARIVARDLFRLKVIERAAEISRLRKIVIHDSPA